MELSTDEKKDTTEYHFTVLKSADRTLARPSDLPRGSDQVVLSV